MCSHRGARQRRRFYAKLCKLRSSVTRAARARAHAHTVATRAHTFRRRTVDSRKKFQETRTRGRAQKNNVRLALERC